MGAHEIRHTLPTTAKAPIASAAQRMFTARNCHSLTPKMRVETHAVTMPNGIRDSDETIFRKSEKTSASDGMDARR